MKVEVIASSVLDAVSQSNEGPIIVRMLEDAGHEIILTDSLLGFPARPADGVRFAALCPLPGEYNGLIEDFAARNPDLALGWRPGPGQIDLVDDILEASDNVKILHLSRRNAYFLTERLSAPDAAQALNECYPETLVAVTGGVGTACFYRRHPIHIHGLESLAGAEVFGALIVDWLSAAML